MDARQIKASDADFWETNKSLVEVLFKGKDVVTFQDIIELRDQFREDLWHYQFHTFEPNEAGRISTENFLKANLSCITGKKVNHFKKHITKLSEALGEKDPGVTLQEFIAIQYFFDDIEQLTHHLIKYKYIEYETFEEVVGNFLNSNAYCKREKAKVSQHVIMTLFAFIDADESGELEPEEIAIFQRPLLSQPKEEKAKADAKEKFNAAIASFKKMVTSFTGMQ